jgi:Zn-dependent protease with chaperone function
MYKHSAILSALCLGLLPGCAGTVSTMPPLDRAAISQEQQLQQQQVFDTHIQMLQRLQSIAWPVLKANADLCGQAVRPSIGLTLGDAQSMSRQIRGLRRQDVRKDGVFIAAVAAGSPAARAGLQAGDALQGASIASISKALNASIKNSKMATIIKQNGQSITITPERICAYPVKLAASNKINAFANGSSLTFFAGLLRAMPNDAQVQMVVAHELAHTILKHPRKGVVNSAISGGWLLGTVAASGGWLVDNVQNLIGQPGPVSYQSLGLQLAGWPYGRSFEREADYVALYVMARSGGNLGKVETLFDVFSTTGPNSTWIGISHPITPERIVALRAARTEIEAKRTRGLVLLPEGWPKVPNASPENPPAP